MTTNAATTIGQLKSRPATTITPETIPALSISILNKEARSRTHNLKILDSLAIDVEPGKFISVVGPSGCGKTSLLRIIAGLDNNYQGEVLFEGAQIRSPSRNIGYVFQEPRLMPWMSAQENIEFALSNSKDRKLNKTRVDNLIEDMYLSEFRHAWPRQLSGGMRQRVALARALVNSPSTILLDEPFGALDSFTKQRMHRLVEKLTVSRGLTAVLITHDIDEAITLGDEVIVLTPRPARIKARIDVKLTRPRSVIDPEFDALRRHIFWHLHDSKEHDEINV